MDKAELIITALQQRVAELELDKAILRAEVTMLMDKDQNEVSVPAKKEAK